MKSIFKLFNQMSDIGKILVLVALLLIAVVFFKNIKDPGLIEGFQQQEKYVHKTGPDIYDEFYAEIYDHLVYNNHKNEYEITEIIKRTGVSGDSVILDVGSGTGHHVGLLKSKGIAAIGLDESQPMIDEAKKAYPDAEFQKGDALNMDTFHNNSFTHILCMYFMIYSLSNKRKFFANCWEWLQPGGYLVVHLVDPDDFDPILPPGNPLYVVSPQKYAKERITNTKVTFNDFVYTSNFSLEKGKDVVTFAEKFAFNNGNVRKQEHVLSMEQPDTILKQATDLGFIISNKVEMVKCAYEHQYLYILQKPN